MCVSGNHSEDMFGGGDDSCLAMECSCVQTQYHQNVFFVCQIAKVDDLYFYKLTSNSPANITRHQVNISGVMY